MDIVRKAQGESVIMGSNTNIFAVGISVEKVQSFLFWAIRSHLQDKQSEEGTLRNIMNASEEISVRFKSNIEERFGSISDTDIICECSGKLYFKSELSEEAVRENLKNIFCYYYYKFQGNIRICYTCFKIEEQDEQTLREKINQALLSPQAMNTVIEENKECIFSFSTDISPNNKRDKNSEDEDRKIREKEGQYQYFAKDINALKQSNSGNENHENVSPERGKGEHFRVAVIKADLDGMGETFKNIKDDTEYHSVSRILRENMDLRTLHEITSEVIRDYAGKGDPNGNPDFEGVPGFDMENFRLFLLYIAGDDLFFIVPIQHLTIGVTICTKLLEKIREELEKDDHIKKKPKLVLRIGIDITFSDQPIRYYFDRVEKQMENARPDPKDVEPELITLIKCKISINNCTFYDFIGKIEDDGSLLQWKHFIQEIKILNFIKSKDKKSDIGVKTRTFLYNLLTKITDDDIKKNDKKYITMVLYHLRPPKGINKSLSCKADLMLKATILKKLTYRRTIGKSEKKEYVFGINAKEYSKKEDEKRRTEGNKRKKDMFENYIRLLLLFSDMRFNIAAHKLDRPNFDFKYVKRPLFTLPLEYMYENVIPKDVRNIFIDGMTTKHYYRTLRIGKGMFLKMKKGDFSRKKMQEMIALNNTVAPDATPVQGKFYFKMKKFGDLSESAFTKDVLDALMVFYHYAECLREARKTFPKPKSSSSKKRK